MSREVTSTVAQNIEHEMESTWFLLVEEAVEEHITATDYKRGTVGKEEEFIMEIAGNTVTLEYPEEDLVQTARVVCEKIKFFDKFKVKWCLFD